MSDTQKRITYTEEDVLLDGIAAVAAENVAMLGGRVVGETSDGIDFLLPRRRGVAASGEVSGDVKWLGTADSNRGSLTVSAAEELIVSRGKRVALLLAGVVGAGLFVIWPFFPKLGALTWIGGLIAIAVYMMAARTTQNGLIWVLLQRIADAQFERDAREETIRSEARGDQ